jgi:hypothetical protein
LSGPYNVQLQVELLCQLVEQVGAFRDIVSAVDVSCMPHELITALPEFKLDAAAVSTLPEPIVTLVTDIVSKLRPETYGLAHDLILRVRAPQPAPFNRVFPQNALVAPLLAQNLRRAGQLHLLAPVGVLSTLLRYGIRFDRRDLGQIVTSTNYDVVSLHAVHRSNAAWESSRFVLSENSLEIFLCWFPKKFFSIELDNRKAKIYYALHYRRFAKADIPHPAYQQRFRWRAFEVLRLLSEVLKNRVFQLRLLSVGSMHRRPVHRRGFVGTDVLTSCIGA